MKIESIKPAFKPLTVIIETPDEAKAIMGAIGKLNGGQHAAHCGFSLDTDMPRTIALNRAMCALYTACKDATQ